MSDKLIDNLAEEIAEEAKKKGKQDIYDYHEKLAYEKYVKTAEKAGLHPISYGAIKRANVAMKKVRSKIELV